MFIYHRVRSLNCFKMTWMRVIGMFASCLVLWECAAGNSSGVFSSEGRSSSHPWHWSSSGAWDRLAPWVDLHLCTGSRSKMNIGTVCHPLDPWSWLEALVHHHPKGTPQASDCWLVRSSHSTATWDHPLPPSPLFFPTCTSGWCQPWHYLQVYGGSARSAPENCWSQKMQMQSLRDLLLVTNGKTQFLGDSHFQRNHRKMGKSWENGGLTSGYD